MEENPDDFEKYGELCESHLQKISNYLGKSNYLYAQACVNYADYYAVTNRPEEGIQHLLEATFVREKSHEKDPQPYIMSWYYQKVSSYYRFHLTDGANAKKYADLNIDILNRMEDVPQYKWNTAFFELAKIYTLLKEYSKSIDYFDKVTWKKGTFDDMSTWSWNGLILELNKNYALSYIKNDKKIIEETNLIINELLSEKYSAFAQNVTTRKRIQEVKDRISLIQ